MELQHIIFSKLNYWIFIILMMLGLWAMISKQNLIKKVMGMGIFQAAIILFYVSIAAKDPGSDIPIYPHDLIHPPQEIHTEVPMDTHEAKNETMNHHEEDSLATEQASEEHPEIADKINPDSFNNPLPHVLMLTAIVVGVATLGVALSLVQRIYRQYGSIEENVVLAAIEKETSDELMIDAPSVTKQKKTGSHA